MAGTRFGIAVVFALQLVALTWMAVHIAWLVGIEKDNDQNNQDLMLVWYRLWQQQQHPKPKRDLQTQIDALVDRVVPLPIFRIETVDETRVQVWRSAIRQSYHQEEEGMGFEFLVSAGDAVASRCDNPQQTTFNVVETMELDLLDCTGMGENKQDDDYDQNNNDDNSKTESIQIFVNRQGTLVVRESNNTINDPAQVPALLLQHLIPPRRQTHAFPSILSCIDPMLHLTFVVVQHQNDNDSNEQDSFHNSWNAWLDMFHQARGHLSPEWLFPISSSSSNDARVEIQTVSFHQLVVKEATERPPNNQTFSYLSLNQIQSFLHQHQQSSSAKQSDNFFRVHLFLVPRTNPQNPLALWETKEDLTNNGSGGDNNRNPNIAAAKNGTTNIQVAASDQALWILLPSSQTRDAAQDALRHISAWVTRRCLGLKIDSSLSSIRWQYDDDDGMEPVQGFQSNRNAEAPSSTVINPKARRSNSLWLSKLFWHRALTELYRKAWSDARVAVERFQIMAQLDARANSRNPWLLFGWIQPPAPTLVWAHAEHMMNQVVRAHALAQQGQFEAAVHSLVQSSSSSSSSSMPPPAGGSSDDTCRDTESWNDSILTVSPMLLPKLILDISPQQYVAIVAPLMVPLLLPALVAVIREAKRFRKLTTNTKGTAT